ncbi:MAG TPA: phosphate ABC transporter permease subunit PstC [Gaiellaceae bacterium]|nr:phosphate ABC transporter permease subunit PstC [Gaiellaceae bacterium]
MSSAAHAPDVPAGGLASRRRARAGDVALHGVALVAALSAVGLLALLVGKVVVQAWPAIRHFGAAFLWTDAWNPNADLYGAASFVFGTVLTSFVALVLATPLAVAIALFLTEIAPRRLAAPIATVVELLAAIPSVVLGLWGIVVMGPWLRDELEPALHGALGWLPIFAGPTQEVGVLPASLILTIMILPIVSSLCRELFSRVPRELTDGALALGSTRWESLRRVSLPYAAPGVAAAMLLGLGRAFGEAIAVTQVIGGQTAIHASLFASGDTLASKIAASYQGATSGLQVQSLLYLAAILMVISLATNVAAQAVVARLGQARRLH